jgi:PAS domain S-box-containing protein
MPNMVDISHEQSLDESRYKSIRKSLAAAQTIILSFTADGRFEEPQPDWSAVTGQTRADYEGEGWKKIVHPHDIATTEREMETAIAKCQQFMREHRLRDRSGNWRRISWNAVPQFNSTGDLQSWTVIHSDITDLRTKSLQASISTSEKTTPRLEYSSILDQLGEAIAVMDVQGKIIYCNDAARRLHGVENLKVGLESYPNHFQLFSADGTPYPLTDRPLLRAVRRGETVEDSRFRIKRADGTEVLVIGTARPLYDSEGNQTGGVFNMHDDTARHAAEEQLALLNETLESRIEEALDERAAAEEALMQAQKMEAVGQLTGGIAHDFNNLLTVVSGSVELLNLRLSKIDDPKVHRNLASIGTAAKRAAALTQRLLAFSRRQSLAPAPTDLNQLIGDVGDMIQRTIGENVVFAADLSPNIQHIRIDSHQLENVLLNLALNARDAMPEGGQLWFTTKATEIAEGHSELMPGDYAVISVIDTGTGMSEETIARAFEPFYTTKEVGKGTGLGLSMIYGFAKQSGGHVDITSELGVGTTIKLYLPVHCHDPEQPDE